MNSSLRFELGVRCGQLLSMRDHKVEIENDFFLGINKGRIDYVGAIDLKEQSAEFIDASNNLVMPGLVNAHSHLPMHLFRGLADDEPFETWLWKNILPLEAKLVSPEFVRLGTQLALLEAITFGITSIYDMYYFEDEIADVCDGSGIRAVVGENFSSFPAPDLKENDKNYLRILDKLIERYGADHDRIRPMVSPHAPYTCSNEKLIEARNFALKHNLPVGIHVAETNGEIEQSHKEFGKTPVQRLHDLGLTDARCIYAHCVHVSDQDINLLKEKSVSISHNPEGEHEIGGPEQLRSLDF